MKRLVQLIPSHHVRDAVGAEVLQVERVLTASGWSVETYADVIDPEYTDRTMLYSKLDENGLEDAIALYHFCGASPMTERFIDLDCPKAIIYHNITPSHFFQPYDRDIAGECRLGRLQLIELSDHVDLAIADSDYSRSELEEAGFDITRTVPVLQNPNRLTDTPDPAMFQRLSVRNIILFVGRLVPNKAPADFIHVAHQYFEEDNPDALFVLVGKRNVLPSYTEEIERLIRRLGLTEDQLLLTDEITDAELAACYASASVFLSLSRHEGFCVPLLEAMKFDVPILALSRAAVPETLGEAGILFDSVNALEIARKVAGVLQDKEMRERMIARGRKRLEYFDPERWRFVFRVLLEQM
jgi:glycosyltransferase involved in cell wall biosynthesis